MVRRATNPDWYRAQIVTVRQRINGAGTPVAVAVVALANSTMQAIVAFGVEVTAQQQVAISGFVNASIVTFASVMYAVREAKRRHGTE